MLASHEARWSKTPTAVPAARFPLDQNTPCVCATTAVAVCRFRTTCAPDRTARSASARPACPSEGGVPPRPSGATTTSAMSRRHRADRRHAEHVGTCSSVGTYSRSHPPPSTGPQAKSDAPARGSITDQPVKKTYKDSRSIHTLVLTRTCVPVLCYDEWQDTTTEGRWSDGTGST